MNERERERARVCACVCCLNVCKPVFSTNSPLRSNSYNNFSYLREPLTAIMKTKERGRYNRTEFTPVLQIARLKLALSIFRGVWDFFFKFILRFIFELLTLCGSLVGKLL